MAEIVDLAAERSHRLHRERSPEMNPGPAQVVLYTGIRYERAGSPPSIDKPKKRRSKSKNKPKNSN